jgi:drug/metabolite transporter superfamily protein YnfA
MLLRTVILFALAAVAEIGGAWLVWQAVREGRPWWWAGLGVMALGAYGFIASLQEDASFGRILAAYGGVFVAGSLVRLPAGRGADHVRAARAGRLTRIRVVAPVRTPACGPWRAPRGRPSGASRRGPGRARRAHSAPARTSPVS